MLGFWLEHLPLPVIRAARHVYARVPRDLRYGRAYRRARNLLCETQSWPESRRAAWRDEQIRRVVRQAAQHVPFWRRWFAERGLSPRDIRGAADLVRLPTVDRQLVKEDLPSFISAAVPRWRRAYTTTGGTTGAPMRFYLDRATAMIEPAFIEHLWARTGYRTGQQRISVRGEMIVAPEAEEPWAYNPAMPGFALSAYHLTDEVIRRFGSVVRPHAPVALHAYPSTAMVLLHYARRLGNPFPAVRVILLGSEQVFAGQREALAAAFDGARVYTWYGHSERCILAGECEVDASYHVQDEYGFVELLDEQGQRIDEPGQRGEIVGTSFVNPAMGFVRYRTGDSAVWAAGRCGCGRERRRFTDVWGRWRQESIVGRQGNLVAMASVNFHGPALDALAGYQYLQRRPGEVEFHYVPSERFTAAHLGEIRGVLEGKLGGSFSVTYAQVEDVARSASGKYRLLIQKLDLTPYGQTVSHADQER